MPIVIYLSIEYDLEYALERTDRDPEYHNNIKCLISCTIRTIIRCRCIGRRDKDCIAWFTQ